MKSSLTNDHYRVDAESRETVQRQLSLLRRPPELARFDPAETEELFVEVPGGRIRMLHHRPAGGESVRPVVFVPGWGTVEEGFRGFFNLLNGRAECYYIETREKNSSVMERGSARFDMSTKAADVARAVEAAGLADRDFLLIGTCWGSAVIAQGLIDGSLSAPTTVLFDPMHRLWFPKWILKIIAPITPVAFWKLIRPLGKRIALAGMREESQRRRTELFIDGAEIWKWKRCAQAAADFELFGSLATIEGEVFVVNGVADKIHDQVNYPRIAADIPAGRFLYLPAEEQQREELIAMTALQFAAQASTAPLPALLSPFERPVR